MLPLCAAVLAVILSSADGFVMPMRASTPSYFSTKVVTSDGLEEVFSQFSWWELSKPVIKAPVADENVVFKPQAWHALDEPASPLSPPCSLVQYMEGGYVCSDEHKRNMDQLWSRSIQSSMRHLSREETDKVLAALKIAYVGLWGKHTARSLEVSINRARGIATVLGELKADVNVILAGLLHEVVLGRSSGKLVEQLRAQFGSDVVSLCGMYARLPKFMARKTEYTHVQSENQLQMLVTSAEDYRVLTIRVADRLHAMRMLRLLPLDELDRQKITQEALNLYALLAHKMGLTDVRGELEDLSFKVLNPELFQRSKYAQIAATKANHDASDHIKELIATDPVLIEHKADLTVTYRIKSKYQLYLKMVRKGLSSPSEVRDALGLRLVVDIPRRKGESDEEYRQRDVSICYYIVQRLRSMPGWEPEAGFKDYILHPKENNYQSLHQYIRHSALHANVEVQVRTRGMHEEAELGGAAHWSYKDEMFRPEIASSKFYRQAWRSKEQVAAKSSAELISLAQKQLLHSRVYVYLDDKSTVLNLKAGSTALDAAFSIHTDVGLSTVTICIDGVPVTLGYTIQTGDVISVQCAHSAQVQATPDWLNHVKSPYALAAMRRHFRENAKEQIVSMGLVKLLMALDLNQDRKVGVAKVVKMVRDRTGQDIVSFLMSLGYATRKQDMDNIVSALLLAPAARLNMPSHGAAYLWATMQGRSGWENLHMLEHVLIPMLRDVLPEAGLKGIEKSWNLLVGSNSLEPAPSTVSYMPVDRILLHPTPTADEYVRHKQYSSLEYIAPLKETPPVNEHHRRQLAAKAYQATLYQANLEELAAREVEALNVLRGVRVKAAYSKDGAGKRSLSDA